MTIYEQMNFGWMEYSVYFCLKCKVVFNFAGEHPDKVALAHFIGCKDE